MARSKQQPAAWAGVVLVLLVGAVSSAVAATAPKDVNAIECPAGPAGWNDPPVTKSLITPETVPPPSQQERWAVGGYADTVNCVYHAAGAKTVTVTVSYALTEDPNPVSDFDLGCGRGGAEWDSSNRVYRAASSTQWAIATLNDSYGELPAGEVPTFEGVTRDLLQRADGYGHPCKLVDKPTAVQGRVYFDILVEGATIKDTFWTAAAPGKGGVYPIQKITALTAALQVKTASGARVVTVRLSKGLDYRVQSPSAAGRVRFGVQVKKSTVGSCGQGASGTLTITTKPAVLLAVCGRSFRLTPPAAVEFFNN